MQLGGEAGRRPERAELRQVRPAGRSPPRARGRRPGRDPRSRRSESTSSVPAGISSSVRPAAVRNWRTSRTRSSSSSATIATAPRMADDLALVARAVGPLDRVDPERQRPALVDHPGLDRRLAELRVRDGVVEWVDGGARRRTSRVARRPSPPARWPSATPRLGVEEVDPVERHDQVDDVAGPDVVLRADDRDQLLRPRR